MSLKSKTIGALSWSLVQEISRRGLQLVISILLARLLGPKEFGYLAMITIFIAVAQALMDSGFGSALIQRKDPSELDKSSVFHFNIAFGILLAAALCVAAPWIAEFYKQPQLTALTRAFSITLVINSLSVVQSAMMTRRLDFKSQAIISAASTGLSGIVGLIMAWRGFGVWSLVIQQMASSVIRTGLYWFMNSWRPLLACSFKSLREMFGFGAGMTATTILNTVFDNLYTLVIGKLFAAEALGFFNRAQTLQSTASQSIGVISNRVTFPVFSQLQGEPERFRAGLKRAMIAVAFVQFPMMLGLAGVAKPLILFLLTDKWAECIPILQLLCFAGLLYPIHLLNLNVLLAMGRSDLFFHLGMIKKVLSVICIVATYRWGMQAMVIGMVVTDVLSYFLNSFYTKRFIGYSIPEQMQDLFPYLLISALMGGIVFTVGLPPSVGHFGQLVFKVALGISFYAAASHILKLRAFAELSGLVRSRFALPA